MSLFPPRPKPIRFTALVAALLIATLKIVPGPTPCFDVAHSVLAADTERSVSKPKTLTTKLRAGLPVRYTPLRPAPGQPDSAELMRRARTIVRSDFRARAGGATVLPLWSIASRQLAAGDIAGAVETIRAAEDDAAAAEGGIVKTHDWACLARLYAAAGKQADAVRLARQVVASADKRMTFADNANSDSMELDRLFQSLAGIDEKECEQKLLMIERRVAFGTKTDYPHRGWILCTFGKRQLHFGDTAGALATAAQMAEDKAPEVFELCVAIIEAQLAAGDVAAAEATSRIGTAPLSDGEELIPLVKHYAAQRDFPAAGEIARRIPAPVYRHLAWSTIAAGQAELGDWTAARRSIAEIADPLEHIAGLLKLAGAQAARPDCDAAVRTLAEARTIRERASTDFGYNEYLRYKFIAEDAVHSATAGRASEAREMLAAAVERVCAVALKEPYDCENYLWELCAAHRKIGDRDGARNTLRRMRNLLTVLEPREDSLGMRGRALLPARLARAYRGLEDEAEADEMFHQALEIARQQVGPHFDCSRTIDVIGVEGAAGRNGAQLIDAELAAVRRRFSGHCPRELAVEIADYRAKQGDWTGAEALLVEHEAKLFPGTTYWADDKRPAIVAGLVRQGRTAALLKYAEENDSVLLYLFLAQALLDQAPAE